MFATAVSMKVTRGDVDGFPVLKLEGEFDSFETDLVRENFEACLRAGRPFVVLDLGDMTFANSTTIAYFITAQKRARASDGRLDQVFTISDSVEAAVAELKPA